MKLIELKLLITEMFNSVGILSKIFVKFVSII